MFNEEAMAAKCIDTVMEEIGKLGNEEKLMVVNDGSTDETGKILKKKQEEFKKNLIILTHRKNKGYGAALQTGINRAIEMDYDYYLTMDSDLTNDPKYIKDFAKLMSDNIDCVKASRYIKGGKVSNVPHYRRIISLIGNYLAGFFFRVGLKDCTNGFKMVKLSMLKGIKFRENNFSIILEELYYLKQRRAHFKEIPITLTSRVNGKSHFHYTPRIFFDYFKYGIKAFFNSC